MALPHVQTLLMSKHFSQWRPSQSVLQLEECIMPPFNIDMNISVICKSIKVEILIRGNQNTHKGGVKTPIMGTTKILMKDAMKTSQRG